jgi:hypothetical protein
MVNPPPERRSDPAYALAQIQALARDEKVRYESWRVQCDVANLGYDLGEVCDCLQALHSDDFRHAERYDGMRHWLDVYALAWRSSQGARDDLYIKLRLTDGCLVVSLHSFHRNR